MEKLSINKPSPEISEVYFEGDLLSIIIRSSYSPDKTIFLTPNNLSQQLGFIVKAKGEKVSSHFHSPVNRDVNYVLETLLIRKGSLTCNLFSKDKIYCCTVEAREGDIIFLASGGHSFDFSEDCEIFEIKQGPYIEDKVIFNPEIKEQIIIRK